MRIVAEHLTHVYNPGTPFAVKALDDVSLTIEEGEFFGVIGQTGSGKSTFVQHLNGLLRLPSSLKHAKKPKKGEIRPVLKIGDFDLSDRKTDFRALRKKVGMVFQYPEYQLFAETVEKDVAFGLYNFAEKGKKPSEEEAKRAVAEALETVGLDYREYAERSPFDLSGGQKRRIAIAGVLVSKPEILVLDEPAAGLDPAGKQEIMDLLHRIHGSWCKTVIVVSHDMDEVAENCTRAAVFSDGKLLFAEAPRDLFKRREGLLALGLDIPLVAKLCGELAARGVRIDCDFTEDGFVRAVAEKIGRENLLRLSRNKKIEGGEDA